MALVLLLPLVMCTLTLVCHAVFCLCFAVLHILRFCSFPTSLPFQNLPLPVSTLSGKQCRPSLASPCWARCAGRLPGSSESPRRRENWASEEDRRTGDHTVRTMPKPGHRDTEGIFRHFVCDAAACPPSLRWCPGNTHSRHSPEAEWHCQEISFLPLFLPFTS